MAADEIEQLAEVLQAQITGMDAVLIQDLVAAYATVYNAILVKLNTLTAKIEGARANGAKVGPSWLYQQGRLRDLLDEVAVEIDKYSQFVTSRLTLGQQRAVTLAEQHAKQLIQLSLAGAPGGISKIKLASLSRNAVQAIVGRSQSTNSPLSKALAPYLADAQDRVRTALINAVVLGYNPKKTASLIRQELGGNLYNWTRMARTEQLQAYRNGSLQTFAENAGAEGVLSDYYEWWTALDERVCSFCMSRHGQKFLVIDGFYTHPQCRCTPIPITKSWDEILGSNIPFAV